MGFLVEIVLVASLTAVAITYLVTRNNQSASGSEHLEKRLAEMENALSQIEKRLKNVETITTSKSFNLEQEFEDLKKS